MKRLALLVLSLSLAIAAEAAVPPGDVKSLATIKDDLAEKTRQAGQLAASIKSLEKEIGKTNNTYLERAQANRSLEEKLGKLAAGLKERRDALAASERQAKKLMSAYALESLDEEDDNALLKKTLLSKLLEERLTELGELKSGVDRLSQTLEQYRQTLEEARKNEESLYSLIIELEGQKKNLSKEYVSSMENKNVLEARLESAMARKQAYKKSALANGLAIELDLIAPLEGFLSQKGSDKGVTYQYDSRRPVKATAAGKVVYSGELASYGKVVMIDHGSELRSVLLGDLQIRVAKGDTVEQGQILGYTLTEPGLKKSLYYEIRKKNVAQNTLQWLEGGRSLANI